MTALIQSLMIALAISVAYAGSYAASRSAYTDGHVTLYDATSRFQHLQYRFFRPLSHLDRRFTGRRTMELDPSRLHC
jgi:hypothetical protein